MVTGFVAMTIKNTSKMTLYEVTNKVAKINGKKAPDVEKVPQEVSKPEKINKKFKMPLVIPQKGKIKRPLTSKLTKINKILKPYYKVVFAIIVVLLAWKGVSMLHRDKPLVSGENVGATQTFTETSLTVEPLGGGGIAEPLSEVPDPPIDQAMMINAASPSEPTGDHVVVLAFYRTRDQLVPVKDFFKENGVETIIIRSGTGYQLITKDRYLKPNQPLSKINDAIQQLMAIGAQYRPPDGFLGFYFTDIYPKKVTN